ncbi:MAG: hypothetical protein ACREQM_06325 [Candidatus Dormibacteraceae bacterium]
MRVLVLVLQMVIRVLWIVQIVIGIVFFSGHLLGLVSLHEALGTLIAICLLILSIVGLMRGRAGVVGVLGIIEAFLLPIVGIGQLSMLPGNDHIVIEVVHLLIGIAAIVLAEMIGARYRRVTRVGRG